MPASDRSHAICIIGAGASGLAAAKNLRDFGIPFDCIEREKDIGGLWNFGSPSGIVYETTHLVSYSRYTGFEDFPMPAVGYPVYPSHRQALAYLKSYAEAFRLGPHIELGRAVRAVEERQDGLWSVHVEGETEPRAYRGVIVANGHHEVARMPNIPGTFGGEIMHSRGYKSPSQLAGKRVLVVGAGNSGCDIVRDGAHIASKMFLAIRRGYWFMPKFVLGLPTQQVANFIEAIPMPRRLRRFLYESAHWLFVGPSERYGLPRPNYHFDEAHPTMSDEIPRLSAHGRLAVKPKIVRFPGGKLVEFGDGSAEEIDLIVFATGYRPAFPFFKEQPFLDANGHSRLELSAFHPSHPMLFACGLSQANGSMWRLADWQGQLIARAIAALDSKPEVARWLRTEIAARAKGAHRWFVPSGRHELEVNYYDYQRLMKKLIRAVDRRLPPPSRNVPVGAELPVARGA